MSNDPETRPSVGQDVHQDPQGDHPSPVPDNARPSDDLIDSDKARPALLKAASVAPASAGLSFPDRSRVPTKPQGFGSAE
jgi:hypothetical protein